MAGYFVGGNQRNLENRNNNRAEQTEVPSDAGQVEKGASDSDALSRELENAANQEKAEQSSNYEQMQQAETNRQLEMQRESAEATSESIASEMNEAYESDNGIENTEANGAEASEGTEITDASSDEIAGDMISAYEMENGIESPTEGGEPESVEEDTENTEEDSED
ncbi:MAG: hypothetical protein LUF35_05750, partial [Lachnospiraceae bacterium]|nr:hypothetical protein [Lachnospiraceae bacterium]